MRLRLTDGTRRLDITTPDDTPLDQLEATAHRLYAALTPDPEQPTPTTHPIGFTPDMDGVSLDATTERAEPYYDGRDTDDDEDDRR